MRSKVSIILLLLGLSLGGYVSGIAQGKSPSIGVIVHTPKPYDGLIAEIERLGGSVTIQYQNADAIAARVPAGKFAELVGLSGVEGVEKDYVVNLPAEPEAGLEARALATRGMDTLSAGDVANLKQAPELYYSYLSGATGAEETWEATGMGANSLVAVIDTGTAPDGVCLPPG
ncbi:MAG: hypothetical protein ACE5JI_17175, partial [Acidobacteriota bacterium]